MPVWYIAEPENNVSGSNWEHEAQEAQRPTGYSPLASSASKRLVCYE